MAAVLLPALVRAFEVIPEKELFPGSDGASPATLDRPLSELLQEWRRRTGRSRFRKRMVLKKSRRRLDVYADDTLVKSYVVNLGRAPVGDKRKQGDMRTPEGDLFICVKNRASTFTRYLGIAYPHPASAKDGAQQHRVKEGVGRSVATAFQRRDRCPPQDTPLGGAVGIHGSGQWARRPEGYAIADWTFGCVAVRDADILELFDGYAEVGVPLRIDP